MKKFLVLLIGAILSVGAYASEAYRIDTDGNKIYHPFGVHAIYEMQDFDYAKESSYYGLGMEWSSISHWGFFHLGCNLDMLINAGVIKNWGMKINFGPSMRFDIGRHFYVNMPLDAVCYCIWPEGSTKTETSWAAQVSPSIYGLLSDRVSIFAGPHLTTDFDNTSFGMQAGINICF